MTTAVLLTVRARAHHARVDAWWRAHRPKAPGLFSKEFGRLLELLAEAPGIGQRYECEGESSIRRYHLHRTGHHVYYAYEAHAVTILGIWNAAGGRAPSSF